MNNLQRVILNKQKRANQRPQAGPVARLAGAAFLPLLAAMLVLALALVFAPTASAQDSWCDTSGQTAVSDAECNALEDLYESTDGDNWLENGGWLSDTAVCDWFGVTCGNDAVTALVLLGNGLSGPLPASLQDLTSLQFLELTENALTGAIPPELGTMSTLEHLSLGINQLTGEIPSELGSLSNLLTLDLGRNALEGLPPVELAQLSNLAIFFLDGNKFVGAVPQEICDMEVASATISYNMLDVLNTPASCDTNFPDWPLTQTVPPTGARVINLTVNTVQGSTAVTADVQMEWTPISFVGLPDAGEAGAYVVYTRNLNTDEVLERGATANKATATLNVTVEGDPISYAYFLRTRTDPHDFNQNELLSVAGPEVQVGTVAVRMLDFEANSQMMLVPLLAPLALLLLTLLAAFALRRR